MESNSIWLVILLPILGFLFQALIGPRLGKGAGAKKTLGIAAVLPIALSFVVGLLITLNLAGRAPSDRSVVVAGPDWISVMGLRLPFEWVVDPLSMTMVLIITGIGALIHLYSTGYMAQERDYSRFFAYLNLFIAAMLILVLGNNLALLFIGWEGVGLCSYLLIGFWYKDVVNAKAANKAFIVNRIGDWSLMLGMFLIVALIATNTDRFAGDRYLSYDVMLPALQGILQDNPGMATAIALLLFGGAAGKSAQFPLYLWLPDAMAGPTPVSALIHAATMVTSGVVLLNRMHVVFEYSPLASAIICMIGAFTALFAALIAFGQTDIKKVLAYSTVSQLGFMFVACGAGAYWAGMFHVTTHAFFKALLFLGAGAVIHAMAHDQDMRNYGNLRKYMPITFGTMAVGWLAISGFPLLSGFFSKEAIIGSALASDHPTVQGMRFGQISGWVALGVAALTALYMTRLTCLTFFGKEERWRNIPATEETHDERHSLADSGTILNEDLSSPRYAAARELEEAEHPVVENVVETRTLPSVDPHGFFYKAGEEPHKEHEHHHALDQNHQPHEVPASMWIPLAVLAVLSLIGGYALETNHAFRHWLYPQELPVLGQVPAAYPNLLYLSLAAAIGGLVLGWLFYSRGLPKDQGHDESGWNPLRRAERDQFGYDGAATTLAVQGGGDLATALWQWFDRSVIDGIVNGSGLVARGAGMALRLLQTGVVRAYALMMLVGVVGILGYFFYAMTTGVGR
jgi:NADH-quinone oxidoreductase subunit L